MATLKQIAANRRNALRSTGPRTDDGKVRSSRNALYHGLAARNVIVLTHEDQAEYDELRDSLLDHLRPADPQEDILASNVILTAWSLRRVQRLEPALFATRLLFNADSTNLAQHLPNGEMAHAFRLNPDAFSLFARYRVVAERAFYKALQEFEKYRTNPIPPVPPPDTPIPTSDTPDPSPASNSPNSNDLPPVPPGPELAPSPASCCSTSVTPSASTSSSPEPSVPSTGTPSPSRTSTSPTPQTPSASVPSSAPSPALTSSAPPATATFSPPPTRKRPSSSSASAASSPTPPWSAAPSISTAIRSP